MSHSNAKEANLAAHSRSIESIRRILEPMLNPYDKTCPHLPVFIALRISPTRGGNHSWWRILKVFPFSSSTPNDDREFALDLTLLFGRFLGLETDNERGHVKVPHVASGRSPFAGIRYLFEERARDLLGVEVSQYHFQEVV